LGLQSLRIDVDLMGLPDERYGGHEVVVDFHVDNGFKNDKTFYTDSNGLAM